MYEEDESNQRCGAILRNDITQPPTYQFRPCSDHLHVLCMDETDSSFISTPISINSDNQIPANSTESAFDVSFKPTSTQIADVQRSGVKNNTFVVGEVVIVNVVLFGLCILVVIMIILRKRLTLQVCQTAKQKFQRCNISKNPMVQTNGNSEMKNRNKTELVRDSYDETWELRRNIVHNGELDQQDIIIVQTEETEI
ncbi:uncharacterized protein LOC127708539 [Mytilus californianus]|uniref:uncharacterized protein LOC127708539 n=1 Tax=Mytilus californianus TaxID=6549 RepID=UPI00224506CB|nr:uncharacterized protein LOC127708539 [Mytilus californianus]